MEAGEASTHHPTTALQPAPAGLVASVGRGTVSFCVCVCGKGGIWKIPELGSFVASDFSCLLHPSSLNALLPEIRSQTLFLRCQSPLALLWVHALGNQGPSGCLHVHPQLLASDTRDQAND